MAQTSPKRDTLASRLIRYTLNQAKYNLMPPPANDNKVGVKLIGHRGCGTTAFRRKKDPAQNPPYVENTFEAFQEGIAAGFNGIEFDIHLTADDRLVVHHDPFFRTKDGCKIEMANLPYAEIKTEFEKNFAARMMTLDEVVAEFGDTAGAFFCELKSVPRPGEFVTKIAEVVNELPAATKSKLHFLSFEFHLCEALRQALPEAAIYFIATFFRYQDFDRSRAAGLTGVMGHHSLYSKERQAYMQNAGLGSGFGITNRASILCDIADEGVDFYFSDNKDLVALVKS